MKKLFLFLFLVAALLLESCGSKSGLSVDLIPFTSRKDGKVSMMKLNGEVVLSDEFSKESDVFSSDGMILEKKGEKVRYYTLSGNKLTEIETEVRIEAGTPFLNGYALVRDTDGRLSFIDKSGKKVLDLTSITAFTIVRAGIVSENLIKVKTAEGLWGYIDLDGKVVINPDYNMVENFVNGKARVRKPDGTVMVINTKNEVLFKGKEKLSYFPVSTSDEIAYFDNSEKDLFVGVKNLKGEDVVKDNKYRSINNLYSSDYYIVMDEENSFGVMNKKGEFLEDLRAKYENKPVCLKSGFAVLEDTKIKFFDKDGKRTTQADGYKSASTIDNEHLIVTLDNKQETTQLLNAEGKEILSDDIYLKDEGEFNSYLWYLNNYGPGHYENNVSLESTYFDFNKNFSALFSTLNGNGVLGLNGQSLFSKVNPVFASYTSKGGKKSENVKADRSLNYAIAFYFGVDDDYEAEDLDSENVAAADTTVAVVDSTAAYVEPPRNSVPDAYPSIGLYDRSYSVSGITLGDMSVSLTAQFSDYIKQATYGEIVDDIFKTSYYGQTGYQLNPSAYLNSLYISYSLDDYGMNEKFMKKAKEKLITMGWNQVSESDFEHNTTGNKITLNYGSLTFYFN
ncbi:MAG: WG repeat-containing protein [Sphingobacteriales bacterium]